MVAVNTGEVKIRDRRLSLSNGLGTSLRKNNPMCHAQAIVFPNSRSMSISAFNTARNMSTWPDNYIIHANASPIDFN